MSFGAKRYGEEHDAQKCDGSDEATLGNNHLQGKTDLRSAAVQGRNGGYRLRARREADLSDTIGYGQSATRNQGGKGRLERPQGVDVEEDFSTFSCPEVESRQ